MCTVSWIDQPGGYHLLCNRDEKRTRGIAEPPRIFERAGARYVAPTDADFRGSWIAVNQRGMSLCLLNREGHTPGACRSRGGVIPDLIWAASMDDCSFLFSQLDLTEFAPFILLMLEPGSPATVAGWDGVHKSAIAGAPGLLTSSSFDSERARAERLQVFARHRPTDAAGLYRFHTSHSGSSGAHAPCMHREDAETVSFSWITVSTDEIRFLYLPAAPCQCAPGEQQILARAA